jgi:DNA primase
MNTNQRIPDQTLQWIRTCVPIPGLIAGTQLKSSGDQLVARCPLPDHDDTHPSFYVSLTKRRFYCHGCKHGGDVIELYRLLNGASFRQAVDTLLERCGRPPAPTDPDDRCHRMSNCRRDW